MSAKSGKNWVRWANAYAENSNQIDDLDETFRPNVEAYIKVLSDAGAEVQVFTTRRSEVRAYLFHWCWKISQAYCLPSDATTIDAVDIEWDHGDLDESIAGALEMVTGFGLAIPPKSDNPPSLTSNHIVGKAIDMIITWQGDIVVDTFDGIEAILTFREDVNSNVDLHRVGESYGVIKLITDAPHWSYNGR